MRTDLRRREGLRANCPPYLRGHGDSPHAAEYRPELFAADLVDSLPTGADIAVGHSLDGRL